MLILAPNTTRRSKCVFFILSDQISSKAYEFGLIKNTPFGRHAPYAIYSFYIYRVGAGKFNIRERDKFSHGTKAYNLTVIFHYFFGEPGGRG
jgi:hypothetical protein